MEDRASRNPASSVFRKDSPAQGVERSNGKRPFGLYAIFALLVANGLLIALDVSRSYVSIGLDFGLSRPRLPGLSNADVDRLLRYLTAGGFFAVSIGIWTLRRWAWAALMIVVGAGLAEGILRYTRHDPSYLIMLFNVLIVFYLNQRSVQRLFRHDTMHKAA